MITTPQPWEHRLFALAREPFLENGSTEFTEELEIDRETLHNAYARCAEITRIHSKTFYMASALLPRAKKRAARALYAFCRTSDDLVDHATGNRAQSLAIWREHALFTSPHTQDPVALAWADTRIRYQIPIQYAEQLIDGVAKDIVIKRYNTFDELAEYAYGVASTVGLMAMHIVGFAGPDAIPYAVKLGVALQLTNILRDIGEDWARGRLYLPQEELQHFDLTETDIAQGRVDDRWRDLMRFQIERTRRLYTEAMPGIALLDHGGRFAIAAAAELYGAILNDIEKNDYDVFSRRAYASNWAKLKRLPGIWWRAQKTETGEHR